MHGCRQKAILSISFPPLCVLRLLVAASCIFNVFFFPSCIWWMFDSTSHGLRSIWPYPAQQASKALKHSHPGAAEWNPVPDSLFKVNNAPAVTPSMWPDHINEPCQREIQRESQGVYVHLFPPVPSLSDSCSSLSAFTKGKTPADTLDDSPGKIFYL